MLSYPVDRIEGKRAVCLMRQATPGLPGLVGIQSTGCEQTLTRRIGISRVPARVSRQYPFNEMAIVPQALLELGKEQAEQRARQQSVAASIHRIKQRYAPLRAVSLRRT